MGNITSAKQYRTRNKDNINGKIKKEMRSSYNDAKMNNRGLFKNYTSPLKCIEN
jgi:hypothetical protein